MKKMSLRAKIGTAVSLLAMFGLYLFAKSPVLNQWAERHPVEALIGITLFSAILSIVTGAMDASDRITEKSLSEWRSGYTSPHLIIIAIVIVLMGLTAFGFVAQQYASYWHLLRMHHMAIQGRTDMLPFLAWATYFTGFFLGYGLIIVRQYMLQQEKLPATRLAGMN